MTTPSAFIGVESKRYEPFRDKKSVDLSDAYDRQVWGEAMGPFEQVRDALRGGVIKYERLDAAQLVKHGFGLTTQARRAGLRPILVYLFAEPTTALYPMTSRPSTARRSRTSPSASPARMSRSMP